MPSWIVVSGFVENVASFFLDAATSQRDVDAMLEEIRNTLKSTKTLVESHKTLLAPEDYAILVAKHRSYDLDMIGEIQPKPRPNKKSRRARVVALYKMTDNYKREAVLLTQRAAKHKAAASPFEEPSPTPPLDTQPTPIPSNQPPGFRSFG